LKKEKPPRVQAHLILLVMTSKSSPK